MDMKMEIRDGALCISSIQQLSEANSKAFREWVQHALQNGDRNLEVDLSQTTFIDSSGLGALVALHKIVSQRQGKLLLLNPQPAVQQIIELTRLDQFFQIARTER
jgi:anti-sigma B factor antagonist